MSYKMLLALLAIIAGGLSIGFYTTFQHAQTTVPALTPATAANPTRLLVSANWGEVHETVQTLYAAADVVVRVRVSSSENRLLTHTLPNYAVPQEQGIDKPLDTLILEQGMHARGIPGTVDQLTEVQVQEILAETPLKMEQVGQSVSYTPFTDSTVSVIETFKGEALTDIIVMQLGGRMPAPNSLSTELSAVMEFAENPLLLAGEEYILFLKDSRNNPIHAEGRALYELVGPTGQFRIVSNQVHNPYRLHDEHIADRLPTRLEALLAQFPTEK